MAQKKTDLMPAGQTNLFDLLKGEGATMVQTETPLPVSPNPVFSIQPADPTLPNGWNEDGYSFPTESFGGWPDSSGRHPSGHSHYPR